MAAETQYTAVTAMTQVSTANAALDGTSAVTVLTAGATKSVLIRSVTFKAQVSTTRGMLRLFIYEGTNTKIIAEIPVPAITKSSTDPSFEITIPIDYKLEPSGILKASTQNAEAFNVIAEAYEWSYYTSSIRPESTYYTANMGMTSISTANTRLDGAGTLGTVLTATSSATSSGTLVHSVMIKATGNTTPGMVRLFTYDGTTNRLIREIPVPAVTKSSTAHSFSGRVDFGNRGLLLKPGWALKAATEVGENFNVIAEAMDWTYPA